MVNFELFEKGGPVMWVLAAVSVYTLAVIFYKIFQLVHYNVFRRGFVDQAMQGIKATEFEKVEAMLVSQHSPIARVMLVALHCVRNRDMTQQSREAEVARVGSAEVRYLEHHLRGLEMVANVGPLLGLLGTVTGMVATFANLEQAGSRVDPSMLAGGIWEALITTICGLTVGVFALASHYIFDGIIERTRATMLDLAVRILTMNDELQAEEIRKKMHEAEKAAAKAKAEESERSQKDLAKVLAEVTKAKEKEEKEKPSTAPQEQRTLRLLNPRYGM